MVNERWGGVTSKVRGKEIHRHFRFAQIQLGQASRLRKDVCIRSLMASLLLAKEAGKSFSEVRTLAFPSIPSFADPFLF